MSPESRNFKCRFIGGFDRHDVMTYIEELAAQRNMYRDCSTELKSKLEEMKANLDLARQELDAANNRIVDIKINALNDAAASLDALQKQYDTVRSDMEVTAAHVRNELSRVSDTLELMSSILDTTGARFGELRNIIGTELDSITDTDNTTDGNSAL